MITLKLLTLTDVRFLETGNALEKTRRELKFNIEDAIAMTNGVDVGLGASVWSADRSKAMEVAVRIEAGTVWINSHGGGMNPMVPFGGTKQSGYGLEFGVEGLKALGVPQVISS